MGLPEPIEPQPDDDPAPEPGGGRADWLCGPEEGLDAEMRRGGAADAAPAPRLIRPGDGAPAEHEPLAPEARREGPPAPAPRLTLRTDPGDPGLGAAPPPRAFAPPAAAPGAVHEDGPAGFSHGPAMLWEPGANSMPTLARTPAAPPLPLPPPPVPAALPDLDFPMDDAEERARANAEAAAAAAAAAERAAQPHAAVAPEAFDIKDAPVPWWMQVPQLLREDRRVQGLVAAVAIVLLAVAFWPRPEKSLAIGSIRGEPARFDGQDVKVSGRVGEVFAVGGGHAFYLHQGRDTIVVFTRSRTPRRGQGVTLIGMVSTGYLNGQSGTAIFESTGR